MYEKDAQAPIFDDDVSTDKFSIDKVLSNHLERVSFCSTFCSTDIEKLRFIQAVDTLSVLATKYWWTDDIYKNFVRKLNQMYALRLEECEPSEKDLIKGSDNEGNRHLDFAVSLSRKKFSAIMNVLARTAEPMNMEDSA